MTIIGLDLQLLHIIVLALMLLFLHKEKYHVVPTIIVLYLCFGIILPPTSKLIFTTFIRAN